MMGASVCTGRSAKEVAGAGDVVVLSSGVTVDLLGADKKDSA
jgi:hypothetical protein